MGQRLNIEIIKEGEVLANAYYHWSGYSNCAVNLAIKIINNFEYIQKYKLENVKNKDLLFAIRLLEETGAGINESKIDTTIKNLGLIDTNINLQKCKGRDEGIIETDEEGIEENRGWEEARLTIDIEKKNINFNVIYTYEEEEVKEYFEEDEEIEFKEINIDFKNIKFEDIFDLKAFIDKNRYKSQYHFKNEFNNEYIGLIQ